MTSRQIYFPQNREENASTCKIVHMRTHPQLSNADTTVYSAKNIQ